MALGGVRDLCIRKCTKVAGKAGTPSGKVVALRVGCLCTGTSSAVMQSMADSRICLQASEFCIPRVDRFFENPQFSVAKGHWEGKVCKCQNHAASSWRNTKLEPKTSEIRTKMQKKRRPARASFLFVTARPIFSIGLCHYVFLGRGYRRMLFPNARSVI